MPGGRRQCQRALVACYRQFRDGEGSRKWGISLGDYMVYWIGLVVLTIGAVIYSVIQLIRGKGRD